MALPVWTDLAGLVGRLALGAIFLAHGWSKARGIDHLRQLEIEARKAALIMRGEHKPDRRPGIVDVRMMVHRLGEGTDLVDEREGFRKIAELPPAGDRLPFPFPLGDLGQSLLDLVLRQQGPSGHCVAFSAKAMTRQKELVGINLE